VSEGDLTEQLKSVASQLLSGDQLMAFMAVADAKQCAGPDGTIDADKVSGHLRTLYGIDAQPEPSRPPQWGQQSGQPPGRPPGSDARDALAKRHGVKNEKAAPGPAGIRPGDRARAALARRHPGGKQ
jgi:hypothetical protein